MHTPTPEEIAADKATAVAGAVEELSWLLGSGWGIAAGLWFDSWLLGLAIAAVVVFVVRRPYLRSYEKAWAKLSSQHRQPDPSQPSSKP